MGQTTTQWILELIDGITAPMRSITDASGNAAKGVDDVGEKANSSKDKLKKMSAIDLYAISDSVNKIASQFDGIVEPGAKFNAQMKEVEAITGVTGDALDVLGGHARDTAKAFGGDASGMMESYKGILSRLGPDIAKSDEAMNTMGVDVATLSKTMGNDAPKAMAALTTAMLQYQVDLDDPIKASAEMTRMMNVMAAGAKEGAAEVPQISAALEQAGVQAYNSKVSFEETNAALQALAQGGKYGSEAGVALRNVLGKMAGIDIVPREAQEKLEKLGVNYDIVSNKTLPLTTRLRELKKAQADSTLIAQIFGVENAAAAEILLRSTDYQDKMREKITGTNVATEQANIIMSGYTETMSRVKAWFTDLAIGAFGFTSKLAPMIDGLSGTVSIMANLANAKQGVLMLFSALKTMPFVSAIFSGGFAVMSSAASTLGVAIMNIPIIGWIAALIAALVAVGVYFYKTSATFRGILLGVWEFIKVAFLGYYKFIWEVMQAIWHVIRGVFDPRTWFDKNYKFADAFDNVVNAAKEYGTNISKAFGEGKEKGLASFYKDHPEEDPKNKQASIEDAKHKESNAANLKAVNPVLSTNSLSSKHKTKDAVAANGGGIKSISQKIDIKNYFTVSDGNSDVEGIAEKVVSAINDRLRDGLVALT